MPNYPPFLSASSLHEALLAHCVLVSSAKGRVFRPKNKDNLVLYLKGMNLPTPDKVNHVKPICWIRFCGFYWWKFIHDCFSIAHPLQISTLKHNLEILGPLFFNNRIFTDTHNKSNISKEPLIIAITVSSVRYLRDACNGASTAHLPRILRPELRMDWHWERSGSVRIYKYGKLRKRALENLTHCKL